MQAKVTGQVGTVTEIDRWDGGAGWLAHPDEIMQRASHALATEAGAWLVDPVDGEGVDDIVASVDAVEGIVLLSNHHARDAGTVASRYDVPVSVPAEMTGLDDGDVAAPVERITDRLPGTDYDLFAVAISPNLDWFEFGLFDGETLVVSESVGTADYICVGDEPLGVMTMRRLTPPRDTLGGLEPERILVGHGKGVFENATAALEEALANSRRRFPRALVENGPRQVKTVTAALRT